jgi:hypothetical protein
METHDCSCSECETYRIEEGAHARRSGVGLGQNPYRNVSLRRQWEVGWYQEERFLRLGFVD